MRIFIEMRINNKITRDELEIYHQDRNNGETLKYDYSKETDEAYSEVNYTLQLLEETFGWFKLIAEGKDNREHEKNH